MKKAMTLLGIATLITSASAYAIVIGPPVSTIGTGKLYHSKKIAWSKPRNPIQKNAISAIDNNQPIYMCSTKYKDGNQVGELSKQGCTITFAGKAITEPHYRVLTGDQKATSWQTPNAIFRFENTYHSSQNLSGALPQHANYQLHQQAKAPVIGGVETIESGYQKGETRTLYICRALYKNGIRVGKVVDNHCNIAWQGNEVTVPMYQVLFVKM